MMLGGLIEHITVSNGESGTKPLSLDVMLRHLRDINGMMPYPIANTHLMSKARQKSLRKYMALIILREVDGVPVHGCKGVTRFVWRNGRWKVKSPGSIGSSRGSPRSRRSVTLS